MGKGVAVLFRAVACLLGIAPAPIRPEAVVRPARLRPVPTGVRPARLRPVPTGVRPALLRPVAAGVLAALLIRPVGAGVLAALLVLPIAAGALDVDFEGTAHGEVVDTDFAGVTIVATNIGGGPDLAVTFDTTATGTSDSDLEVPFSGGNLGGSILFGNALIIQENAAGCGDDICNNPDDEGTRPAGSVELILDEALSAFGFDLLDIDAHPLERAGTVVFHDDDLGVSFAIEFNEFDGGTFAQAGFAFGDHSANRIAPISVAEINAQIADPADQLGEIDRVIFNLGGSGALDNLVPEPSPAALLAVALLTLAAVRRR